MSNKPNISTHERSKPHTGHGKAEHQEPTLDSRTGADRDGSSPKEPTLQQEQDVKRRIGQFGEAGEPPLMEE